MFKNNALLIPFSYCARLRRATECQFPFLRPRSLKLQKAMRQKRIYMGRVLFWKANVLFGVFLWPDSLPRLRTKYTSSTHSSLFRATLSAELITHANCQQTSDAHAHPSPSSYCLLQQIHTQDIKIPAEMDMCACVQKKTTIQTKRKFEERVWRYLSPQIVNIIWLFILMVRRCK